MSEELSELLFNALNEQGYLFQEACAHVLRKDERTTGWEVRACEYPVSLQGQDTKIDIVLASGSLYALVECKRADPSYVYWVFGAAGPPCGDALCSTLGLECRETWSDRPYKVNHIVEQLHFGIVTDRAISWLEAKRASDRRASTPQNIENAFGQVLKGVGGFALEHLAQRRKSAQVFKTRFVPVVITTASLFVANYEPKDIDLSTGKIGKDKILFGPNGQPAEEVEWVLVDYGVGENVAQKPIPENYHAVDPAELQKHKVRSIFVVNSKSIIPFFSSLSL